MIMRPSSFLGISVSERAIACAEITTAGERRTVRRLASFNLPQGVSFDNPDAAGQAIHAFLRENQFSASRAVVGVPAKWLIAMEREIPPSDDETAEAMLRLQAERLAVSESGEMVFDYVGEADRTSARKVLLTAMLRQRLDQVEAALDTAGLSVLAISSSALTLARGAAAHADQNLPMVLLNRGGAEVVFRHQGAPRSLRHVSVMAVNGHGPVPVGPLSAELSRAVALVPTNGNGSGREMLLWDGVGLSDADLSELSSRMGFSVRHSDALGLLGLQASPDLGSKAVVDEKAQLFAPALSLALAGADRTLLPLDFKHSRLSAPRTSRVSRRTMWLAITATVVVGGLIYLYLLVGARESHAADLRKQLKDMGPQIKANEALADRVNYARGYFETRPPVLECLRELTTTFRDNDPIWVTSVSMKDSRKGILQGKAADKNAANALVDRIRGNKKFAEVKIGEIRDVGGKSRDVTFQISFTFTAPELVGPPEKKP